MSVGCCGISVNADVRGKQKWRWSKLLFPDFYEEFFGGGIAVGVRQVLDAH
jgi:hypothetical protein